MPRGLPFSPKPSAICEISVKRNNLFMQNKPNFRPFWPKNRDSAKKQTQNKAKLTPFGQSGQSLPGKAGTRPDFGHLLLNTEYWILELKNYESGREGKI
jgi:hypothetical protein